MISERLRKVLSSMSRLRRGAGITDLDQISSRFREKECHMFSETQYTKSYSTSASRLTAGDRKSELHPKSLSIFGHINMVQLLILRFW